MLLGRFGGSRVAPDQLFDPTFEAPPLDAWDVQLHVPQPVSTLLEKLHSEGRGLETAGFWTAFQTLQDDVRSQAQVDLGFVVAEPSLRGVPARLQITCVLDETLVEAAGARPHLHVYLGASAESLLDGQLLPLDEAHLHRWAQGPLHLWFRTAVEDIAADELGLALDIPITHPARTAPAASDATPADEVCRGRWGERGLILAG